MVNIIKAEKYSKKCYSCGIGFNQGYIDIYQYFCSETCLIKENKKSIPYYTIKDWQASVEAIDECYYTEWEYEPDEFYNHYGIMFKSEDQFLKFESYKNSDSVIRKDEDVYVNQKTQYKVKYNQRELFSFFNKEYYEQNS